MTQFRWIFTTSNNNQQRMDVVTSSSSSSSSILVYPIIIMTILLFILRIGNHYHHNNHNVIRYGYAFDITKGTTISSSSKSSSFRWHYDHHRQSQQRTMHTTTTKSTQKLLHFQNLPSSSLSSSVTNPAMKMTTSSSTTTDSSITTTNDNNNDNDISLTTINTDDTTNTNTNNNNNQKMKEELTKLQSKFLITMRDRGYIHQCTNLLELDQQLLQSETSSTTKQQPQSIFSGYLGFDATADSLHVGSLLQIMILRHFQRCGHRPIVLLGGGTSKVGDPTGKDISRQLLSTQQIHNNMVGISQVFHKFLQFNTSTTTDETTTSSSSSSSPSNNNNDAIMVNNDDWLGELKYLNFLRDYGTYFTINRMLSFESVKQRLDREAPFTFLEFNYMILQAYDFVELYRRYNTTLQLGGSDQWGNMISGTELGRKCSNGVQLFALTAPLITTQDGKKMGKTANGAIWLNANKLSEYDYWQFWRNTDDADVIRFLKLFTELSLDDIEQLALYEGADINKAKIILADEATALLHGRECLHTIHQTIDAMFTSSSTTASSLSTEGLPRTYITMDALRSDKGVNILDLLVELKLVTSKKEGRRLIQGGGARIGDDTIQITDDVNMNPILSIDNFPNGTTEIIVRAGKKRAGVVQLVQD